MLSRRKLGRQGLDVIPGTKRRTYLEENVAAAELSLDRADMRLLDEALAPVNIAGPRYNERQMSFVDR